MTSPVLVRRLVVVAGLVACVLAAAGLALGATALAGTRAGSGTWLVATAVVALVVPLARPRLDVLADRVAFGPGGDPYAVVSGLVRSLSEALAVDDVLPQLARAAAGAVHGDGGRAHVFLADGSEHRQTWPPERNDVREDVALAVRHAGSQVGSVGVQVAPGALSPADRAALDRLAGPAGLALANVRLTYDLRDRLAQETALADQLRASRQRLLDAAQVQRDRFAEDVARLVQRPLREAGQALDRGDTAGARAAGQAALDALRDLATGVFPPALTERGLVEALDLHLQRSGSCARLTADGLSRLAPAVEAAAWACALGLLGPQTEEVRLSADGDLLAVTLLSGAPPSEQAQLLVRDRAEAAGGTLRATGGPAGWALRVELPVDAR